MSDELQYIFKIRPETVSKVLPDALPVDELDAKSGFIHMSTASQIPNTLKHFFSTSAQVTLLRVDYQALQVALKRQRETLDSEEVKRAKYEIIWESPDNKICGPRPGEGLFPHIYNGLKLGKEEIESIQVWYKEDDEWETAVHKAQSSGWLV